MPDLADPVTVTFEYRDADGIETRRTVDVYETIKKPGYTLIKGWCHGRQDERTFRSDRLISVINGDGEVIEPAEFVKLLRTGKGRAAGMVKPDRSKSFNEAMRKIVDIIAGLFALAAVGHSIYGWITSGWVAGLVTFIAYMLVFAFFSRIGQEMRK